MRSPGAKSVRRLFEQAVRLPPEEQQGFLEEACGGDTTLFEKVMALVRSDSDKHSLLQGQAVDAIDLDELPSFLNREVGAYRIVRELASGGMGAVFLAERADGAFEQRVAVKFIKRGMDSADILKRFQSERQILARLQHPNIARLLDGGVTQDGLPYFTMEYVDGAPITDYCDQHKLSIEKRLRLFQTVCSTVNYAHRNMLIHRDIKPGNILVTEEGAVKLLDFGIAKALSGGANGGQPPAPQTRDGERFMTPEYASPEQARGETVNTASDVYSLGVVLYELLTGRRPYRFQGRSRAEIERAICATEPPKPSTAIGKKNGGESPRDDFDTDPSMISQLRATHPGRLRKKLAGDLDNICLAALKKDPERRYLSVEHLREDLSRYLSGLPVRARSDTFAYRAKKFAQRNKPALTAALSGGLIIVALVLFYTASLARERDRARVEAKKAQQVAGFLSNLFTVSDPGQSKGATITARELLENGARRIENELGDQPEVRASMMSVIGDVYRKLGLYDAARQQLRGALHLRERLHGTSSLQVADALSDLAGLYHDEFDYKAVRNAATRALSIQRPLLAEFSPEITTSLHLLAQADYLEGNYEAADSVYQALLTGRDSSSEAMANILRDYGVLQREMGNYAAAEKIYRKALAAHEKLHGSLHPEVATDLHNLGDALRKQGKLDSAEAVYRQALRARMELFGEVHPDVGETLNHIARVLSQKGDYPAAEPLARHALQIRKQVYGEENVAVVASAGNLAGILMRQGELAEAERLYRWNVKTLRKLVGVEHPYYAASLNSVAGVLLEKGDLQAAKGIYTRSLLLHRKALPEGHINLARPLGGLARALLKGGDAARAEPLLREALELNLSGLGQTHWRTADVQASLGRCLLLQQKYAGAEVNLRQALATLENWYPERAESKRRVLRDIVSMYEKWGRPLEAAKYRER